MISMCSHAVMLPTLENGFRKYIVDVRKFPLLEMNEEYFLACDWRDNKNPKAAHRLITSHLRLVVALAMKYRGYGLPVIDLVSEGNIGLMQAVKKFDPDKGFRLATYAMWWIRASIQEYILRSWSLVKIGTTMAQKKLFFGLNKAKKRISALDTHDLHPDEISQISKDMDVPEYEVVDMNRRLLGADASLNTTLTSQEGGGGQWQDHIADPKESHDIVIAEQQEYDYRTHILHTALSHMSEREQHIIKARKMTDPPVILDELAETLGISRERVRQIESRAFEKLKDSMLKLIEHKKPKLLTADF